MNLGLKKYLENIIGDNILRKIFFGKLSPGGLGQSGPDSDLDLRIILREKYFSENLSPGGLGQSGPDSELDPRCSFQKMSLTQSGRTGVSPGGLRFLLDGPKSVQCSEINFN